MQGNHPLLSLCQIPNLLICGQLKIQYLKNNIKKYTVRIDPSENKCWSFLERGTTFALPENVAPPQKKIFQKQKNRNNDLLSFAPLKIIESQNFDVSKQQLSPLLLFLNNFDGQTYEKASFATFRQRHCSTCKTFKRKSRLQSV